MIQEEKLFDVTLRTLENEVVEMQVFISPDLPPDSHLGMVLNYLDENSYDLLDEIAKLLRMRFLAPALQKSQGYVDPTSARECADQLRAMICEIEQTLGISK